MKLTSYGAAEGVTGSCHLLEIGRKKILLDCGIFQGSKHLREQNEPPFPFDPADVDFLLVSHAHLDHIGRIPLLYKQGFDGQIISTRATYELARLSLLDSAGLLDSEARRRNRRRRAGEEKVEPLYDEDDVLEVADQWTRWVGYDDAFTVCKGVECTMRDAGHILGSAFLDLELDEEGERLRMLFSGDLGNVNKPIIRDPETPPAADLVMMESTYGNRDHRPFAESRVELIDAINDTLQRGGNAIIPTFALERAQELLYVLHEAWQEATIPDGVQIFLDSPMAISATRIFERHPDCYDAAAFELRSRGEDPFEFPVMNYTRSTRESMKINDIRSGAIILAGSGMVTGGRVIHHLRHHLMRDECSVIFIGYQAEGTPGRHIVDGADFVTLHGQSIPVHAHVYTINGFSAHAGRSELTSWAEATGSDHILLVHGEQEVKRQFAGHLRGTLDAKDVSINDFGKSIDLVERVRSTD